MAVVHAFGVVIKIALGELAQIGRFGQKLAQPAVGVFVRSTRPRGMGIAEPDVDLHAAGEFGVAGHFEAPVAGQALSQKGGQVFIWRVKPSTSAAAPLPSILARVTKRVLRSTRVPTEERLDAPLILSPAQ